MRKSLNVLAAALLLALAGPLAAQEAKPAAPAVAAKPAELPDPVVVVNGAAVSRGLFEIYSQERAAQLGDVDNAETRKALADELVLQELLVQEAKAAKLDQDPEIKQQLDLIWRNLLASALVRQKLETLQPSDAEIKAEYDKVAVTLRKPEFKARHILVEQEDEAKQLLAKLKAGANFEQLAKDNSKDASASEGGDLGWFSADVMVPEFAEAVAKLEKGKTSEAPVKTQFGWHIIHLDDTRTAEAPSLEELKPQIIQLIQGRKLNEQLEEMKKKAKIEIKLQ